MTSSPSSHENLQRLPFEDNSDGTNLNLGGAYLYQSNHSSAGGTREDGPSMIHSGDEDSETIENARLMRLPTPAWHPAAQQRGLLGGLRKFWRRQVSITVPHEASRDHLGMFCLTR